MKVKSPETAYQESHDAIFRSGAFGDYSWWRDLVPMHAIGPNDTVPSYWGYRLVAENPEDSEAAPVEVEIFHITLIEFMHKIANGDFDDADSLPPRADGVSTRAVWECSGFLHGLETDFDADTADQVLQAIVYGGLIFG